MTREASSIEKAVREAMGDRGGHVAGAEATPEQLDLIADQHGGKLPPNVFRLVRQQEAEQRKQGRPRGARNKASIDLARLIEHEVGNPVLAMGRIADMPLDQQIQLIYAAEGVSEREDRLFALADTTLEMIADARRIIRSWVETGRAGPGEIALIDPDKLVKMLGKLSDMTERVVDMAQGLKAKPGELGFKLLNLKLAAWKATSEYYASKKPVEANVSLGLDGVMVMPGAMAARETQDDRAAFLQHAGAEIAKALASGAIEARQLENMRLNDDGQLVDADFEEVPDSDDGAES